MLLGILGQIGSGKDEVTKMLRYIISSKRCGVGYEPTFEGYLKNSELSFMGMVQNVKYADKLKELLAFMLGVDVSKFEDREFKNTPIDELELVKVTYASPLRDMSHKNYSVNLSKKLLDTELHRKDGYFVLTQEEIKVTPRWLMINIGTNAFRRIISEDWWVCETFKNFDPINSHWIISDVRFPNEVKMVEINGGFNVGVRRYFELRFPEYKELANEFDRYEIPKTLEKINPKLYSELTSESEMVLINQHNYSSLIIENNGSLSDLYNHLVYLVDNNFIKI